jgi:hypothetical protein
VGVEVVLEEGRRYGSLLIQRIQEPRPAQKRFTRIWCDCDCGAKDVETSYLALQRGKSDCGDLIHKDRDLPEPGTLFGGAAFLEFAGFAEVPIDSFRDGKYISRREQWKMRCPCGEDFLIQKTLLDQRLKSGVNDGKIFCCIDVIKHRPFIEIELPEIGTEFRGAKFLGLDCFRVREYESSRDGDVKVQEQVWRMQCVCDQCFTIPKPLVYDRLRKNGENHLVTCGELTRHATYQDNSGVTKAIYPGDKLGYLTLLYLSERADQRGHPLLVGTYSCSACGSSTHEASPYNVVKAEMASCGCMRTEANVTHGLSRRGTKSREFQLFNAAKARAKKEKIPFNIEIEDVVVPEICPILGIKIDLDNIEMQSNKSPSLDKIIPNVGYVKGNIQVLSLMANRLKNDGRPGEWEQILKWMEIAYQELPSELREQLSNGIPHCIDLAESKSKRIYHSLSGNRDKGEKDAKGYQIWNSAKQRARIEQREGKGTPFNLLPNDISIPKKCPVLGIVIDSAVKGKRTDNSPSIDRLVPELGYVKGNIHIMSWRANRIKNNGSLEDWKKLVEWSTRENVNGLFQSKKYKAEQEVASC